MLADMTGFAFASTTVLSNIVWAPGQTSLVVRVQGDCRHAGGGRHPGWRAPIHVISQRQRTRLLSPSTVLYLLTCSVVTCTYCTLVLTTGLCEACPGLPRESTVNRTRHTATVQITGTGEQHCTSTIVVM